MFTSIWSTKHTLCEITPVPLLPLVAMWPCSMKIRRVLLLLIPSSQVLQNVALPFATVSKGHGNVTWLMLVVQAGLSFLQSWRANFLSMHTALPSLSFVDTTEDDDQHYRMEKKCS